MIKSEKRNAQLYKWLYVRLCVRNVPVRVCILNNLLDGYKYNRQYVVKNQIHDKMPLNHPFWAIFPIFHMKNCLNITAFRLFSFASVQAKILKWIVAYSKTENYYISLFFISNFVYIKYNNAKHKKDMKIKSEERDNKKKSKYWTKNEICGKNLRSIHLCSQQKLVAHTHTHTGTRLPTDSFFRRRKFTYTCL